MSAEHWLLRIGDGNHFISSSKYKIWGVSTKTKDNLSNNPIQKFLKEVKKGDILWFIKSGSKGKAIAVASFKEYKDRVIGPLITLSATNEELGWTETQGNWDIELHYEDLWNTSDCEIYTQIQSPLVVRKYNSEKCKVDLPLEYTYLLKFSKLKNTMK